MKKIAIHSVPRSGSSWLGEIINSSPNVNYNFQPLFSYAFKSRLDEKSSSLDIENFYQEISQTDDEFIRQLDDRESGKKPVFQKDSKITAVAYKEVRYHYIIENLLGKCPEIKVIGLVRNPYSVINSWFNAPREFRIDLGWDLSEELLGAPKKNQDKKEEYFGLNKWVETTLLFEYLQKKYPNNFYLLKYEELCSRTIETTKKLFSFLELEYTEQTNNFLSSTEEIEGTYSVMKNKKQIELTSDSLPIHISDKITEVLKNNALYDYSK